MPFFSIFIAFSLYRYGIFDWNISGVQAVNELHTLLMYVVFLKYVVTYYKYLLTHWPLKFMFRGPLKSPLLFITISSKSLQFKWLLRYSGSQLKWIFCNSIGSQDISVILHQKWQNDFNNIFLLKMYDLLHVLIWIYKVSASYHFNPYLTCTWTNFYHSQFVQHLVISL